MRGHTHLMLSSGLGYMLFPELGLAGAIGTAMGGLLPDLDHPHSTLGKFVPFFSLLGGEHRGWFHSLVGMAAFTLPVMFYSKTLAIGLAVGFASHLVLDTLNPTGVAWAWPVSKKKIHLLRIRTGSVYEAVLFFGMLLYLFNLIW